MTLHQLKAFVTTVKLNSFAQAAKALHISQPTVSGLIQDLQDELGTQLFERLGNKRQLTEAGKRLFRRAESGLATIEGIREEIDELAGLKKGRISVGSAGIGTPMILPAVQEFKELYPGVDVSLTIQRTDVLNQKLLDGELDVAVLGRPSQSNHIVAQPYRQEELVFIAPPKHPLAKKRSVPLRLLADEPLITFENDTFSPMVARRFNELGISFKPLLKINIEMGSREAIKSAVANGLGISFLTKCHVLPDAKAGRLKILKVPDFSLQRTVYIAFHKKRKESFLLQSFIELLEHY